MDNALQIFLLIWGLSNLINWAIIGVIAGKTLKSQASQPEDLARTAGEAIALSLLIGPFLTVFMVGFLYTMDYEA